MKKENRKKQIEKSRNGILIKIYLWIFLIYILVFLGSILYEDIADYLYGSHDWEFSLSGFIAATSAFFFNIYNLVMVVIFYRKNNRGAFYLSLSELAYLLWLTILPIFFLPLFSSSFLIYVVKIAQLVFIIYLLFKQKIENGK